MRGEWDGVGFGGLNEPWHDCLCDVFCCFVIVEDVRVLNQLDWRGELLLKSSLYCF